MPSKPMTTVRRNATIALLAVLCTGAHAQTFTPLLDGSLEGWSIENTADDNIRFDNGVLVVGAAPGWLQSGAQYANFTLRLEFRFLSDDADSGIFVRALADSTFGPGWPNNAYQVQLRNPVGESRFPPVGGIFRHGLPDGGTDFDPADAARLSSGTGVWQTLQIEARGDALTVWLNDELLTRAEDIVNPTGYIGIQAETGQLEFRAIEIAPLSSSTQTSDADPERFADDMAAPLPEPDGRPNDVFVKDGLHLNDKGNRLWQQALLPYLASD